MKKIISITLKLFIITVISGLALGAVNYITEKPIAQQLEAAANEARQSAFPEAAAFEALDIKIPEEYGIIQSAYNAKDSGGKVIGIVAAVVTRGFNSGLNITVGIGSDGRIRGVIIGDNSETPGLGKKAAEPEFYEQYNGKSVDNPVSAVKSSPGENDVQAITGATVTSKGVTAAVNTVAQFYKEVVGGVK